jgi:hypothetical protein
MPGGLAPLRQQLIHKRLAGFQVASGALLRTLNALLLSGDPQLIISHPQQDFIAHLDTQRPAKRSRDDNTSVLAHTNSGFFGHGVFVSY